ncbi:MAG TPA: energy transducer TonB [Thermoanaerobaculia bacterium]|nr:energy transducer TonB [Thermoanaerobaculia bacterium]
MKATVRSGFIIALALSMLACREDNYQLRTSTQMSSDGRSYLTIEVWRGGERVVLCSGIEMVPGNGAGGVSQSEHGPKVRTYAEFDKEGRGAVVTLHVTKEEEVLAHSAQFVERPAPAGYVRAAMWKGMMPPDAIDRVSPSFPEKAFRNRRQGVVFVDARINTRGTVDSVAVLNPAPYWDGLDQAAAEAVRRWRFRPATSEGKLVAVAAVQQIHFDLPR